MKVDSTYVQQVRHDHDYLWEIYEKVPELDNYVEEDASEGPSYTLPKDLPVVCLCLLCAVVIGFVVYKFKKYLNTDIDFVASGSAGMGRDTIHNHNWDKEIDEAMASGNYDEAAVLGYLFWLYRLNVAKVISFKKSKTPGIFLEEVEKYVNKRQTIPSQTELETYVALTSDPELLSKTRQLTNQYLQVRYGHRHVTAEQAQQILTVARQ